MIATSLATLHVISHIRWEREGVDTFESARARLLDTLAYLLERMNVTPGSTPHAVPLTHVLLGGQTVLLEDVASVRPDLLALLVIVNGSGKLSVGPWYVQVDEALVSGEALVRNLLMARADARQHGASLMPVAYAPESGMHAAQLPQLLRGFGLDAAFVRYCAPVAHLPLRWEAPDGSSVLAVSHDFREDDVQAKLSDQKALEPDGPILWMHDCAYVPPDSAVAEALAAGNPFRIVEQDAGVPLAQSALADYVKALRKSLPDALRPALKGELRAQSLRPYAFLTPGTLSARLYLKQNNARLQARLTCAAEPWLAVALTHAAKPLRFPQNLRALLDFSWRALLKNQARTALGGCSSDAVHEQNEARAQQVEDNARHVVEQALRALPGTPMLNGKTSEKPETFLVVWNPHGRAVRQVLDVALKLPRGKHPAKLLGPDGEEKPFGWQPYWARLTFAADAPPVGYAAYTLVLGDTPPPDYQLVTRIAGSLIASVSGERLVVENERLTWKRAGGDLDDLLRFFDGGDAGDTYNYSPPHPDVLVQADLVNDPKVESSPLFQRLILQHRMRITPGLRADRGRDRGVKLLELTTTATFYDQLPGVFFQTTLTNNAHDHRLRAHLRTGIRADDVLADTAFGLVRRPARQDGPALPPEKGQEGVINTYPLHTAAAIERKGEAMALLTRGLPEFESLVEDGQNTLALTLLRAVGTLSRADLRTRTAPLGEALPVPGAQVQRGIVADYALVPMSFAPADLLHAGSVFNAALQVVQYSERPPVSQHSYLLLDSPENRVLLSALKPPAQGNGWIVRVYNPTSQPTVARLGAHVRPKSAQRVTLAEEPEGALETDDDGRIKLVVDPQHIVTVRFGWE